MKANILIAVATALFLSPATMADHHEKGEHKDAHEHEAKAGPNGGKVLHEIEPHAELFVTKERKLQVTFLNDDGKAIAPESQTISVICGKRSAPTRMKFEKSGSTLLSDKPLPAGKNVPTVVQIKMKPEAKTVTLRLNLNLEDCPSCEYKEYACVCDHGGDDKKDGHEGHDH